MLPATARQWLDDLHASLQPGLDRVGAIFRRTPVLFIALSLAVLATYANHFGNEFHFDDSHTVVDNPFIRQLRNVPRFFTDPTLFSVLPDHATWRPLVSVSLALDYGLAGGLNPFWFHATTFAWYLVELGLLLLLYRRLVELTDPHPSNAWAALLAAAVYGLHPVCAETVNYVIQRGDLFCTLGIVASVLWFAARPERRRQGWYLLPAVAAFLSKAPALIYPFILLAYVWLFENEGRGGRDKWKATFGAVLPALLVTAVGAALTAAMTPHTFKAGAASRSKYLLTQPWVALHYFKSFFLPTELSADSDWGYVRSAFAVEAVAGYLAVAVLLGLAWWTGRRRQTRPVSFGLWWFLLALFPTSALPLAEVTNDHRMFFPFAGLSLAVVWSARLLLFRATGRLRARRVLVFGAAALAVVVLFAAALKTWERNEVWHTEESLWRDVVIKSPHNGRGLMNYGLIFMARGEYGAALALFENALQYTPYYRSLETNLGIAHGALHHDAEAELHFRRSLELAPNAAEPRFFYARWLRAIGRSGESAALLEEALRLNRASMDARDLLLEVYADQKNWPAALRLAEETLDVAPGDATAERVAALARAVAK